MDNENAISEPPLTGRWRHGSGYLSCGTLRIGKFDFDTNPTNEFKKDLADWVCNALNTASGTSEDTARRVRVDTIFIPPGKMQEAVKQISTNWLEHEVTKRLQGDIAETMRFIKNLEAIKFTDEQCEVVEEVVSANYTTDENGRLLRLEAV